MYRVVPIHYSLHCKRQKERGLGMRLGGGLGMRLWRSGNETRWRSGNETVED